MMMGEKNLVVRGGLVKQEGKDHRHHMAILTPVFHLLLLAAVLLPLQLWWHMQETQCPNPSRVELLLERVTGVLWISWLTHAAGLMDEALRVFLGIRLTQGLGTPTSVDKVYSKMSRWAEVVAEGIAVDDFPSLASLYAAAGRPSLNQRASSGDARDGRGGGNGGGAAAAAAGTRVDKSLVMKVDRIAATAQLWSLAPWSRVRRYDRVHVKGITLRLRQVNGILNFSFLALNKKGRRSGGVRRRVGSVDRGRRRNSNSVAVAGGDGFGTGDGGGGGMEDLDGMRTDTEDEGNDTDYYYEDEEAFGKVQVVGAREERGDIWGEEEDEEELAATTRRFSDAHSDGASSSCSRPGFRPRKGLVPWATRTGIPPAAGTATTPAVKDDEHQHGGANDADVIISNNNGERSTVDGRVASPRWSFSGPSAAAARATRGDPRVRPPSNGGPSQHAMGASAAPPAPAPPSAENVGNLGVFKVLGEAFMRRFNAYCEQVSAAFDRVGDIKLVPKVCNRGEGRRRFAAGSRRRMRFEVGEILLEEVCVCVDAGVWNDLLGGHVGAAFSPEFRMGVKVGAKELLTPNGEGRLAREIGILVNDKLVRLLARLVMRQSLKTSTLTNMVITSLALDTDARGRKQGKQNKSLSPPPFDGERERGALARSATASSAAADAALAGEAKAVEHHNSKYGRFWRFGASSSASSTAAALGSTDLHRSGSGRRIASSLPTGAIGSGDGSVGGKGTRSEMTAAAAAAAAATALAESSKDRKSNKSRQRSASRTHSHAALVNSSGSVRSRDRYFEDASSVDEGATAERGRGRGVLRSRKSLPSMGKGKGSAGWGRSTEQAVDPFSLSPPPPQQQQQQLPRRSRVRRRPSSVSGKGAADVEDGDGGDGSKNWFMARRGSTGSGFGSGGGGGDGEGSGRVAGEVVDTELESVANAPPWMEGVQAHAEYEEMKPTLDVIKQTVLLAVLQQSNRTVDVSSSFTSSDFTEAQNEKQNGRSWGRRQGSSCKREEVRSDAKVVEENMQEELLAARRAGGDVDRLVMKELLARVRSSGPNTAFKALASIELSSFIENLAAGTRFAQHLENVGIDVTQVAQSLAGLTAGDMMEGVKDTAGKVGGKARRLRTEAMRVQKELLDETGILPMLDDAGGGNGTSIASAVESLSGTLSAAGPGTVTSLKSPSAIPKDSWERGVAVSTDSWGESCVEKPLGCAANGNLEEVDEVDVVMQVLDLLEAVESLKVGIRNGDGVALGRVEQAVGKVAQGIDVYLILAASESMLGFLLERLGKLPVGHAKFAGKGVEARVWNLNLDGVQVARENVDLVMKGFRLPKRGTAVMTQMGPGKIKRYKKRSRCFVVNLDWKLGNGKPVKAYLQPNDIVVLEGHEGGLSDVEEDDVCSGSSKVTVDSNDAGIVALSVGDKNKGAVDPIPFPPPRDNKNAAPRAEKGRWPSLARILGRRKSAGAAAETTAESRRRDENGGTAGEPAVGDKVSIGERSLGGGGRASIRTVTAAGSSQTKPLRRPRTLDMSVGTLSGTVQANASAEEPLPNGGFATESAGCLDDRSDVDGATVERATAATSRPRERGSGRDARRFPRQRGQRGSTLGPIAGPTFADVMSAPFLVARISGVGAELKDVKWSVKQTHFPHLKTAGSLEATVSGLTLELELDTQDLPPLSAQRREQRSRATATEGDDDSPVKGGAGCYADDGSSGGGGGGGGGGGEQNGTPKLSASDGDTPKGLRLNRLRVSVRTVKVHVSNSALSGVYNLVASAFEAAVKRYVVESVEAAVRKNVTSLLSVVNKLMGQKWDILRSVSGGSSGGVCAASFAAQTGKTDGPRGNAVDKVLATSMSHHVLWAAVAQDQEDVALPARSAMGADALDSDSNAAAAVGEKDVGLDQQRLCHSSRGDSLGSGSSKASMESGEGVSGGGGGAGDDGAKMTASMRQNAKKRSFRNRLLEAVGRVHSAGDVSSIDLSSSSESPSVSLPPSTKRHDPHGEEGKRTSAGVTVEVTATEEAVRTSPYDTHEEGANERPAFVYEGRMELPPSPRGGSRALRLGKGGGSSLDSVVGRLEVKTRDQNPLKDTVGPGIILGSRSQQPWSKQATWASAGSLGTSRSAVTYGEGAV